MKMSSLLKHQSLLALLCFVCLVPRPTLTYICTGTQVGTSCFYMQVQKLSWQDAEVACQQSGMRLAHITNSATTSAVQNMMTATQQTQTWIGAKSEYRPVPFWRWLPDKGPLQPQGCYYATSADGLNTPDMSVQLATIPNLVPALCIQACLSQQYTYAAVQNGNQCWCGLTYGQFGQVTESENVKCTTQCVGDATQYCGGTGRNFVYYVSGAFGTWQFGKPNNNDGFQTCSVFQIRFQGGQIKMDDDDCYRPYSYICDIPMALCQATTNAAYITGSVNGVSQCAYVASALVSYFSARMACVAMGGDLLQIDTADKYNWMAPHFGPDIVNYWVGAVSVRWLWEDGSDMLYYNWIPGYPVDPTLLCIKVDGTNQYEWNNDDCDNQMSYICEATGLPTTEGTTTSSTTTTTTTTTTTPSPSSTTTTVTSAFTYNWTTPTTAFFNATLNSGKSSDNTGSTLTFVDIILIVICCLLILLILIVVIVVVVFRKQHAYKVSPEEEAGYVGSQDLDAADARPNAHEPVSEQLYWPPDDGSTAELVNGSVLSPHSQASANKVTVDDRH